MSMEKLTGRLQDVAKCARQVKIERENFVQLADYLEEMVEVAFQLQNDGNDMYGLFEVVEKDVDGAYDLVNLCISKSRMYLLTHCRILVRQLEDVTREIGRNLGLIPLGSLKGNEDTKALITDLSQNMQRVQFQVKESEERICRALERETSNIRNDLAVQTGLLVDIARTVGVEDFAQNPNALRNQIDLLRNDIQGEGPDDLHMMNLIGNMFENFVRRQGQAHSSSHTQDGQRERRRIEEPYDTFKCPLTREVMAEPVTIVETGKIYERKAIERWFSECKAIGKAATCPLTSKKLDSVELKLNIALRSTIEEWHARNEVARIENAVSVLSSVSPEVDVAEALEDLQTLCHHNKYHKSKIKNEGLIPIIVDRLKNDENIRCSALMTLRILAEDDDEIKECIGETKAIASAVKCFSRELPHEIEEAVSLLLELSKHYPLCEKIGSSNGAILYLVGMTSSNSENIHCAQKAEATLSNLERCNLNVRQMAENGRLEPLITRLLEGTENIRTDMANDIAEIPLNDEGKARLAEVGGNILVQMLASSKNTVREAALKALRVLSTLESNGKTLIEAGVLKPVMRDLFMAGIGQVPTKLKEVAATILANVVNSGSNSWEGVEVDSEGNTLTSETHIHNLLLLISNTGPAIGVKLLQVLYGLLSTSSRSLVEEIVNHIKSAGVISLIQFLEAPQKDLLVTSVRLLHFLSSYMGQELADGLRRQLGTLVKLLGQNGVSVEMAAAAGLLANLPVTDSYLTRALLDEGVVPVVINRLREISKMGVRIGTGRHVAAFQEGLASVLARFTYDLEDPDILNVSQQHNLCALFISLLQTVALGGVQKSSAMALENLSMRSKYLSEIPENIPASGGGGMTWLLCCTGGGATGRVEGLCRVHGGRCSVRDTFCLVEGGGVDALVGCLEEQRDVEIMEYALQAVSTLIKEPCDVERGVEVLGQAGCVGVVLSILREHRTEGLRERAMWIVERMLRNGDVAESIVANADVHTSIVDAFRHGNFLTKQLAERSLRHLNRIPNFSGIFPNAGRG